MMMIVKFIWHAGAVLFWGVVLITSPAWLLGGLMASQCESDQYQEIYSPDKSMRAVVTNSDCGATTNFQTKVFIEKVDGSRVTKALIRLDGHPKDVSYKLSWLNDTEFLISEFEFDDMLGFTNQSWGTDFVKVHFKVKGT